MKEKSAVWRKVQTAGFSYDTDPQKNIEVRVKQWKKAVNNKQWKKKSMKVEEGVYCHVYNSNEG